MGISLDMPNGLRVIDSIVHLTTPELWNQGMLNLLKNDLISGSNQSHDLVSVRDQPSTLSQRLFIMDNITSVQPGVEQRIIEYSKVADDLPVDEVTLDMPELNE